MKKYKIIILFQFLSLVVFAQQREITGTVSDKSGELLPGVNVILKGKNVGANTDFNGKYSLKISNDPEAILVFSYIGLETKEIAVGKSNTINAILQDGNNMLDEVVVTALGIKRDAKSLAYARQSVNTEGIEEARSTDLLNSLSGKVAGVSVVNSGTPSGSSRIVIRGITSVTGNNQPLYVVDGIALDNTQGDSNVSVWDSGEDIDYGSPISQISPDDIQSMEVLKGANAAALYGSRASNGVIIITTKKGTSKNNLGISVNSNTTFTSIREYPEYQYVYGAGSSGRMVLNPSFIDAGTGLPNIGRHVRAYGAPLLGFDVFQYNNEVGQYLPRTENIKDLYQTGATFANNISINKAYDSGNFRVSYTNTISDFVIPDWEEQKRHNLTFSASQNISKKLTADVRVMYTNDNVVNRMYQNGSNRNPANNYLYIMPDMYSGNLLPYKDENGNAYSYSGPFINPYWNLYENSNEDTRNKLIGSVGLKWKINDEFNMTGKIMGDLNFIAGEEFNNMGASYDVDGYYRTFDQQIANWNYEAMLNYKKDVDKFSILGTIGTNKFDYTMSQRGTRISSLLVPDVRSLSNSNGVPDVRERDGAKTVNSVFGSLSVGYNNIIYLDATARNDWSSTLPADNNSYFYPSIGTSFIFSKLLPNNDILKFGKLRVSYAEVGNDTNPYNILTTYNYGGNYNGTAWLALNPTRKNPDLKPELTSSLEFGLETNLLKNRLTANVTYYESSTINQIIEAQVSPTTGFQRQVYNAGEIENKGWEVFLHGKALTGKFKWDVDLNWSKNESMVVSLIGDVERLTLRDWFNVKVVAEVGKPFGEIRGNIRARDPETGHTLVKANGRVIGIQDEVLGNAQADWIGGLKNSFSYKGFSLSFLLDFKKGGDLYSGTMVKNMNHGMHALTLEGRDDYYFSNVVLGENNNERRGQGLFGYEYNEDRAGGRIYENSAVGVQDADGNWVAQRDADGNVVMNTNYINPQEYGYDAIDDQERVTYDTSYIKLREAVLGYTWPKSSLKKMPFQTVRVSVVGRNLWTIHKNTPIGIDPESGTTAGNGQGIEFGSFLPTRSVGLNVKLSF